MIIFDVFHSSLCGNWDREAPLQCLACSAPFRGNAPRNSFPKRSGVVLIAKVTTQPKCIYSRAFSPNVKFYMEVAHSARNFRIVLKTTPGKTMLRHFDTCAFIPCYFCRRQWATLDFSFIRILKFAFLQWTPFGQALPTPCAEHTLSPAPFGTLWFDTFNCCGKQ